MGMFDEIIIPTDLLPKPLPKYFENDKEAVFQTKDLNNCLDIYSVSEDGYLALKERTWMKGIEENKIPYHGEILCGNTNICAAGPYKDGYMSYTKDGVPAENVDYVLVFTHGKLEQIKLEDYTSEPARDSDFFAKDMQEKDEERERIQQKRAFDVYLNRIHNNLPGDEVSDWLEAEEQLQNERMEAIYKALDSNLDRDMTDLVNLEL